MSTNSFVLSSIAVWSAVVVASFSTRILLADASLSLAEIVAWVGGSVAPAMVLVSIVRSATSQTIAQVLYDTEHPVAIVEATTVTPRAPRG